MHVHLFAVARNVYLQHSTDIPKTFLHDVMILSSSLRVFCLHRTKRMHSAKRTVRLSVGIVLKRHTDINKKISPHRVPHLVFSHQGQGREGEKRGGSDTGEARDSDRGGRGK